MIGGATPTPPTKIPSAPTRYANGGYGRDSVNAFSRWPEPRASYASMARPRWSAASSTGMLLSWASHQHVMATNATASAIAAHPAGDQRGWMVLILCDVRPGERAVSASVAIGAR